MGTSKPRLTNVPLLCALLERPVPIVVSTVAPSGRPQSSVVWVERRGDQLAMFFANRSAKLRNLRQNPALAIIAVDEMNPLAPGVPPYALITGTAEIGAPELEMPDRLARA